MNKLKEKSTEIQKLLPNLAAALKSHEPNRNLRILRNAKEGLIFPTEDEIKNIKSDAVL